MILYKEKEENCVIQYIVVQMGSCAFYYNYIVMYVL